MTLSMQILVGCLFTHEVWADLRTGTLLMAVVLLQRTSDAKPTFTGSAVISSDKVCRDRTGDHIGHGDIRSLLK